MYDQKQYTQPIGLNEPEMPARELDVFAALYKLTNEAEMLADSLVELDQRLEPVSTPKTAGSQKNVSEARPRACGLSKSIEEVTVRVICMRGWVREQINSLEI